MKEYFFINPDITFLNFGSFGAVSKPVMKRYQDLQLECETNSVEFITKRAPAYMQKGKEALGKYLGCEAQDLLLVSNPSYAVNLVAKNINLQQGDEILATHIEYGACDKTWDYYCDKVGAIYKRQVINLPIQSSDEFVDDFFEGLSKKTKLIFISHITSSTALIFPVKKIIEKAKTLGIPVFVDGAHAPGHIPLNINELGCDYYTGACHKWMMTPKGCSFLYTKKDRQAALEPLIVSWGYKSLFPGSSLYQDYHQTNGTRDLSPFCILPEAIQFMEEHDWQNKMLTCRSMVRLQSVRFSELLQSPCLAPVTEEFIPSMLSLEVHTQEPEKLKNHLFDQYKIEIPVMRQADKNYIRFSIQAFNSEKDLDNLYNALTKIINEGIWIKSK